MLRNILATRMRQPVPGARLHVDWWNYRTAWSNFAGADLQPASHGTRHLFKEHWPVLDARPRPSPCRNGRSASDWSSDALFRCCAQWRHNQKAEQASAEHCSFRQIRSMTLSVRSRAQSWKI